MKQNINEIKRMQQLAGILVENELDLDVPAATIDMEVLSKFTENGKYDTNSSQHILSIKKPSDDSLTTAKDALNKLKEINNYLNQTNGGNKWFLRGIAMGYQNPKAMEIANELKKLHPSGEVKPFNKDNVFFYLDPESTLK